MRYVIIVWSGTVPYTYGPFSSRTEATQWAEENIQGLAWNISQYIVRYEHTKVEPV